MSSIVIVVAVIIVLLLASYAGYLLLQVKKQQQASLAASKQRTIEARAKKQQVLDDIKYIATAMLEERCEPSEGVMRIAKLFDTLSMSEAMAVEFPHIFEHYACIKDHPIKDARSALPKQQRMKLDLARMKSEAKLEQSLLEDAKKLKQFHFMH
ncbi:DUF2489 domain-containing protein [Shewanella sp. 6_MG-2023]|uniref:DUF2489 domain-containing protein n=1 Tax=Shewanella sp. 6_MG-2023 TaxID=3062660 RepID=UPI0026E2D9C9|nr:DUF2489 domain-containing protein [Shewanella sp. 6_MG-2023]MDO6620012.1 DUF2489 domain-containing protein [Shewanella sp. 6_MG-2023]